MKTFSSLLIICLMSTITYGQTQIAAISNSTKDVNNKMNKSIKNASFINSYDFNSISSRVEKLHKQIAEFDITELPQYDAKDPSTYNVAFNVNRNKIIAVYNSEGQILDINGSYTNIKLPYKLSAKVSKEYPGWEFKKTWGDYHFVDGKASMVYKVLIKKDGQSKTLKLQG